MVYQKLFFLLCAIISLGCSKAQDTPVQTVPAPLPQIPAPRVPVPQKEPPKPLPPEEAPPLAIIKSGDNPLWFELGSETGLSLITAPEEASLTPFEPWPLARLVTAMALQEEGLIMGINREGFLLALPWKEGGVALYRIADPPYWGKYTLGSLFVFEGNPAALLYRNDFFADPPAVPPSPRVFTLLQGKPSPLDMTIPAFEAFPPSAGWDVESLRQGQDGYWYYRGVQRSTALSLYQRTPDLSLPGETISVSVFRNSALPLSLDKAPPLLGLVLERVFRLNRGKGIAGVISPSFPSIRYFSEDPNPGAELTGYYLNSGGDSAQALVILSDGRGIFGKAQGEALSFEALSLPPLPEGFVYTRIGLSGNTIFAAWEEQQELAVGAAGLMAIRLTGVSPP